MVKEDKLTRLEELFGLYRTEWINKQIFKFFATPSYFNDLKNVRPCVIQGGRGSGKTTVLRGLSYEGQFALNGNDIAQFDKEVQFIGIYFKADTNRVRAFQGKGIPGEYWMDLYAHYFNLIIVTQIVEFILWHKKYSPEDEELSEDACRWISISLLLGEDVADIKTLERRLRQALISFQSNINNISIDTRPPVSLSGMPIQTITDEAVKLSQFRDKIFFLLIDEYENLLENQQLVMNSLLKHTPESYTFKIGVKSMGWKVKTTLNREEVLNDPADYVLFDITDTFSLDSESAKEFNDFAEDVCMKRIAEVFKQQNIKSMDDLLESKSIEEEAIDLGVKRHRHCKTVERYAKDHKIVLDIHPLYKFFLDYWAETQSIPLDQCVNDFLENRREWNQRYDNYKYSLLFKIRTGRGSNGTIKYYGGWSTFIKLANGNIRFLMELVYKSLHLHLREEKGDVLTPVKLETQTQAAKNVGRKNLGELESSVENGTHLTRMVQSLGTVFGALAKEGKRLSPEINQFELQGTLSGRTESLLAAGVMHLALVRMPANKLASRGDVKDYMYSLHPLFAPYYDFSFRKKRKIRISEKEFLLCVDDQLKGVGAILNRKKVSVKDDSSMLIPFNDF